MARFIVTIPDDLNNWLVKQARLNLRSRNKEIEHILETACKIPFFSNEPRYTLNSRHECSGGHHYFVSDNPAMGDYCNCRVFIYGEVVR